MIESGRGATGGREDDREPDVARGEVADGTEGGRGDERVEIADAHGDMTRGGMRRETPGAIRR